MRKLLFVLGILATLPGATGRVWGQVQIANVLAGRIDPLDGIGTAAHFRNPWLVVMRGNEALISDKDNGAIRKYNLHTREVTTLLTGLYKVGGLALSATNDSLYFSTDDKILKRYRFSTGQVEVIDTLPDTDIDAMICTRKGELIVAGETGHRILLRNADGTYKLLAGKLQTYGYVDGIDSLARFFNIASFALSHTEDTLYICDRFNSKIRRLIRPTRMVSTVPVASGIYGPKQLAFNKRKDSLFIANASGQTIIRFSLKTNTGQLWCGSNLVKSYADGPTLSARFNYPHGIALCDSGFLVVDNVNQRLRRITPNGYVSTLAGMGIIGEGTGTNCKFLQPYDIVKHPRKDTVYVTDQFNHAIRQIDLKTLKVTTLAGSGVAGNKPGIGSLAELNRPTGMAITQTGDSIYFVEPFANKIKLLLVKTGEVKWVAGSDTAGFVNKPTGKTARFNRPQDIALKGNLLYIADALNHRIRTMNVVTTEVKSFAGLGTAGFKDTVLAFARFNRPSTLEWADNYLFIGEDGGLRIRRLDPDGGTVSNWAGNGTLGDVDGLGAASNFRGILKLSYNPVMKLLYMGGYVNEGRMRLVGTEIPQVRTFASTTGFADGLVPKARFTGPMGVAVDTLRKRILIAEAGNSLIRKVNWYANHAPHARVDTLLEINEDHGLLVKPGFAQQLHPGLSTGDTLQKFSFATHLSGLPQIDSFSIDTLGTANLIPATDSNGTYQVKVVMKDNGGTVAGGVDSSIYVTKVRIVPVNDPPVFTIAGTDSALYNQPRIHPEYVSAGSPGPFNERFQTMGYTVFVDHPEYFTVQPYIENNALKFTPNGINLGEVNARLVARDNGGLALGGVDSTSQPFLIVLATHVAVQPTVGGMFSAYPNPVGRHLHFNNLPERTNVVEWYNSLGQRLATQSLPPGQNQVEVPVTLPGVYSVKLTGAYPLALRVLVE